MTFRRAGLAFALQHLQGVDDSGTGVLRFDDQTRIAAWYGVAKLSMYSSVLAFTSGSFLKMILAAPAGPITATSAVGQAMT